MKQSIVIFLIALLTVFTGIGCSDDDGDGNGFVKFTIIAPDYEIPSLDVSLTSGFSGDFVLTNVPNAGVTNVTINTFHPGPLVLVFDDQSNKGEAPSSGYIVWYAFSRSLTAADMLASSLPDDVDNCTLKISLTNVGTTNNLIGRISLSNTIYSKLQKVVDFSELKINEDNSSVTITSFGEAGGYISGTFNITLTESTNKTVILTNGSFSFFRIINDEAFISMFAK